MKWIIAAFCLAVAFSGGFLTSELLRKAPAAQAKHVLKTLDGSEKVLKFEEEESILASFGTELIDPASAQFQNLTRSIVNQEIVCGDVNAKNRFGGYVGFVPFVATLKGAKAEIDMPTPAWDADGVRTYQRESGCYS